MNPVQRLVVLLAHIDGCLSDNVGCIFSLFKMNITIAKDSLLLAIANSAILFIDTSTMLNAIKPNHLIGKPYLAINNY